MIKLVDAFWTVQGEGAYAGSRALFVRLPFCNLQCPWCDTEFNTYQEWTEDAFLKLAISESSRFAVITGGEPTKSPELSNVMKLLESKGFYLALETNGTYRIPEGFLWATVSPKRYHLKNEPFYIHPDAFKAAHEFKYVIEENFPWDILKRHNTSDGRRYSLSPEFNSFEKRLKEIIDFQKENPRWKISLQTHKWMMLP